MNRVVAGRRLGVAGALIVPLLAVAACTSSTSLSSRGAATTPSATATASTPGSSGAPTGTPETGATVPAGDRRCAFDSGYTEWGSDVLASGGDSGGVKLTYVPSTCWYNPSDNESVVWTDAPTETAVTVPNSATITVYELDGQTKTLTPAQLVGWKFQNSGHIEIGFSPAGVVTRIHEVYHP